jgi:hypothetical protein
MIDRDQESLPRALRDATRALRDEPEVSDLWRQRLLREIAASGRPTPGAVVSATTRRWSMRPSSAIAAGILCACLGAGTTVLTMRALRSPPPAAGVATRQPMIRFTLVAPAASRVSIVGDFNGWDPAALPLRRSSDGRTWEVEVPLAPGRYAYAFVVDGALARDPSAPQAQDDDFGSPNSILMVRGS